MKICDCYKEQLLKSITEKNDISFLDLVPKCKHKDTIIKQFQSELLIFITNNDKSNKILKLIGGLKNV